MYRLLTGRLPFDASTQAALTYAILNTEPPRPATLRPDLPRAPRRSRDEGDGEGPGRALPVVARVRQGPLARHSPACAWPATSVSESEKLHQAARLAVLRGVQRRRAVGSWCASARGRRSARRPSLIREGETGRQLLLPDRGRGRTSRSPASPSPPSSPGAASARSLFFADKAQRRTTTVTAREPDHRDGSARPKPCAPPPTRCSRRSPRPACAC